MLMITMSLYNDVFFALVNVCNRWRINSKIMVGSYILCLTYCHHWDVTDFKDLLQSCMWYDEKKIMIVFFVADVIYLWKRG